ncbi:G-box-binding factor 1-like isoform X3 [Tasmannia lanceolata]|uniref:G-box-binding factor 1-like isoform X3 n=1 Tax=Tasmannia lanceolata TaxID=3420 RepID=UPI0040646DB8
MGSGEESTPTKPTKPTAATQELPSTPSYSDWATSMQAYYGAGGTPPPFFTPTVSSPTPHPYMWGGQHLMPPYGTPLPYPAMYPPGGIYGHPSMASAQGTVMTPSETERTGADGKDRVSTKNSKESSGNMGLLVSEKSRNGGKAAPSSANDGSSESGGSGIEGYSDTSDENTNQQEFSATRKRSFDQMLVDGANAQNNNSATNPLGSVPGKPAVTVPTTNLNIGMDLWNTSSAGAVPMKARPNAPGISPAVAPSAMVGRDGVLPEQLWIHDERELKRQRRKQSNRESARRSRLRKQAECEQLAAKVDSLTSENQTLRNEMQRLAEDCEKLTSENASIREQLTQLYGHDVISTFEGNDTNTPLFQSIDGEGNSHAHDTSRGTNSGSDQKNDKFFSSNRKLESSSN